MAVLRTGEVTVDGIRSPLLESGPQDSTEAVIYVHGSPGSCGDFRDLLDRTGEFARAIAIDVPGFGQAGKPDPKDFEYSVPSLGIHLGKQLDELGIERAHLVGHDFGGGFAHFAAMWNPARVGSLAMINTGVLRGYRWHIMARIWRTPVLGELMMLMMNEQGFARAMRELPDDFVAEMWRNLDRDTRRAILALYRGTDHADSTATIPMLRAMDWPSIVIFGADDQYIPARFAERNLETLPSAEVHVLQRAGHWPFIDRPQAFADLLLPFLRDRIAEVPELIEDSALYR
jgi:pimeloyl-ACP methyl ester carboxylesterase